MTGESLKYLPPVECQPWCDIGDGHPQEWNRPDQACWTAGEYVDLSQEPPAEVDGDKVWPQTIGVLTRRRPGETAHVLVHLDGVRILGPIQYPYNILDHELLLTAEEAQRLAALLTAAAELAQQ